MAESDAMDRGLDPQVDAALRRAMAPAFTELRAYLDRRLAEVSAEIHNAVRTVGSGDVTLSGQLGGIQDQVARVLAAPDAAAPNSGVELHSVLAETERAAHRILEAAEAIGRLPAARDPELSAKLEIIFSACEFQDLAGQRIRRAIEHLHLVEGTIAVLASNGAGAPLPDLSADEPAGAELAQGEIDRLLG
jgi:chemotaxis protein CheZ